jgi:GntR family transcriptional regulator, transcriptional repressor for pyruvate dehydrogenase complex
MFKSIKPQRISDEIANQIKSLISDGKLRPGDRLPPERELIKQFEVSRPSLREALKTLVAMGFLEVKQAKRTYVKSVTSGAMQDSLSLLIKADAQKIFDLVEVRKAMEAWGAFHAAQRASEEDLQRLEKIVEDMKVAVEKGKPWEKQDADFHLTMAQATHNTIQIHMMSTIYDLLMDYMSAIFAGIFTDRDKIKKLFQQHYQIFNAIKNHSPEKARERILKHLDYVESELKGAAGQKGPGRETDET